MNTVFLILRIVELIVLLAAVRILWAIARNQVIAAQLLAMQNRKLTSPGRMSQGPPLKPRPRR